MIYLREGKVLHLHGFIGHRVRDLSYLIAAYRGIWFRGILSSPIQFNSSSVYLEKEIQRETHRVSKKGVFHKNGGLPKASICIAFVVDEV